MSVTRLLLADVLQGLPPVWPDDPRPAIRLARGQRPEKVVVLDDDPTGTQTVHGVPVLTVWSVEALAQELLNDLPALYILTNSRSMPLAQAQALNATIGAHLRQAASATGRRFVVVSRSDSTLRGHFPGEVEALASALGQDFAAWLLIPFFQEGGRYTIANTHYVADGEYLVPAGETEFARDAVFGYQASDLRLWVEEKTSGRISASAVAAISLQDLRHGGPSHVTARLRDLQHGSVCVVNAASQRDLEVFTQGLLSAEASGQRFLYRTAASFVAIRADITPRPLLTAADMVTESDGGGLILVGSYVPRSSGQLTALCALPGVHSIEIQVQALLEPRQRAMEISRVVQHIEQGLARNEDVVVFTSRTLVTGTDASTTLAIGQNVSAGLVAVVQALQCRPRYVLAKGGITSSDIATQGLGVQRAMVLGQILPGVPVWQLGSETRYPGMSYIVFPGNVGGPEALAHVVTALRT
ncbi:MAG: four-carbon acid sugar kinase family protein [Candidatus Tectimicrobiota bacterium]